MLCLVLDWCCVVFELGFVMRCVWSWICGVFCSVIVLSRVLICELLQMFFSFSLNETYDCIFDSSHLMT